MKTDKKKAREKEIKKKLLAKRLANRAKMKEEREQDRYKRELQKATNKIEGRTFRHMKAEDLENKLAHNLEILEALDQEQKTLQEQQHNAPMVNTTGVDKKSFGASADVVFTPNPE